jgi:hypothetical protein
MIELSNGIKRWVGENKWWFNGEIKHDENAMERCK